MQQSLEKNLTDWLYERIKSGYLSKGKKPSIYRNNKYYYYELISTIFISTPGFLNEHVKFHLNHIHTGNLIMIKEKTELPCMVWLVHEY